MLSLLDEACLVDDQYPIVIAQVFDHIFAQHIACGIGIPGRTLQQVLHPVGCGFAHPLGQLPAVSCAAPR